MTETSAANTRGKDIWKVIPGIVISVIAIAILLGLVDWQEFGKALRQADYRYLALAFN